MPRSSALFASSRRLALLLLAAGLLLAIAPFASAGVEFSQGANLFDDVDGSGGASCGDPVSTTGGLSQRSRQHGLHQRHDHDDLSVSGHPHPRDRLRRRRSHHPVPDRRGQRPRRHPRPHLLPLHLLDRPGVPVEGDLLRRPGRDRRSEPLLELRLPDHPHRRPGLRHPLRHRWHLPPFEYDPCPAPVRPRLLPTLVDSLVVDGDGDGLVDPGDTVRYRVDVTATLGDLNVRGIGYDAPPPAHGRLVVGSVTAPVGGHVLTGNDPGDATVSVSVGTISPSTSKSFTYDVVVDDPVPPSVSLLSSQGLVTALDTPDALTDDPDRSGAVDPTLTPLDFDPDLAVVKTSRAASARPGDTALFDLAWSNASRSPSSAARLTETVPPHAVFAAAASSAWSCADGAAAGTTCTLALGTLSAGASGTAVFAVRIDPTLPVGVDSTTNRVTIADDGSQGADLDPTDNTAEATLALDAAPELGVTKTGPPSAAPGDVVPYQIEIENTGDQDAGGIEIRETVPAHTTFVAGASTAGWSCPDGAAAGTACTLSRTVLPPGPAQTVVFAVRIAATLPAGVEAIDNHVELAATNADPVQDSETTPVDAAPDLHVEKSGPATASAGDLVAYDLAFGNRGNQGASGVTLTETVPNPAVFDAAASSSGWSCSDGATAGASCTLDVGTLASGASGSAVFAVRLPASIPGRLLVNEVSISDDGTNGPDPRPADNTATAETEILGPPDLHVEKDGPAEAAPDDVVAYRLTYGNAGEVAATGVVLTETVPSPTVFDASASTTGWSCTDGATAGTVCTFALPTLAPGDSSSVTFAVRLPATIPAGVEGLLNRVSIADDGAHGIDPTPADNTASLTTSIDAAPDLVIDKDDGDLVATPGSPVTYAFHVLNSGNQDATEIILTDTLPSGVAVEPASSTPGWTCSAPTATSTAVCAIVLDALAAGAEAPPLLLAVVVDDSLPAEVTALVDTATVEDDGTGGPDLDPSDNQDTETTPVDRGQPDPPVLAASLVDSVLEGAAAPGVAAPGAVVSYVAVVTNRGAADAAALTLVLPPDEHTRLRAGSVTTTAGSVSIDGAGSLHVALPTLAAGDSLTVTFEVDVDDELPPGLDHLSVQGPRLGLQRQPDPDRRPGNRPAPRPHRHAPRRRRWPRRPGRHPRRLAARPRRPGAPASPAGRACASARARAEGCP